MSPVQRSEDPARNLDSQWLGPSGAWRWWFDATYVEWAAGLVLSIVIGVAYLFVVPAGLLIGLLVRAFAYWLAKGMPISTLMRLTRGTRETARRRAWRGFTVACAAMVALIWPNPMGWLHHLPWWAVPVAAVMSAALVVRRGRPHVDGNRPIAYWVATLRRVAGGPRPRRTPISITPTVRVDIVLDDQITEAMSVLDFNTAVAAINPKEIVVTEYRRKSPPFEAMLWDSTTQNPATCEHVVAWLRSRGVEVQIEKTEYYTFDDQSTRRKRVVATVPAPNLATGRLSLQDGHVVLLEDGRVTLATRKEFAEHYEAVPNREEAARALARQG
jgi:hypothetical protein